MTDENSPLVYRPSGQIQIASNFRFSSVAKSASHQGTTIMLGRIRALALLLVAVSGLSGCGGGSSPAPPDPPPPVDTELDWDQGNWDQENWQ